MSILSIVMTVFNEKNTIREIARGVETDSLPGMGKEILSRARHPWVFWHRFWDRPSSLPGEPSGPGRTFFGEYSLNPFE
jgi:hypothetical protein